MSSVEEIKKEKFCEKGDKKKDDKNNSEDNEKPSTRANRKKLFVMTAMVTTFESNFVPSRSATWAGFVNILVKEIPSATVLKWLAAHEVKRGRDLNANLILVQKQFEAQFEEIETNKAHARSLD